MRFKHGDEQVVCHNAVKQSIKILKTSWHEDLTLQEEYSTFRKKFVKMFTQLPSMWEGELDSMKAVQHHIGLGKTDNSPIPEPYTARASGEKIRKAGYN